MAQILWIICLVWFLVRSGLLDAHPFASLIGGIFATLIFGWVHKHLTWHNRAPQ